jgi:hypothetical protein
MRENRPYGSEGGEAKSLPYPYPVDRLSLANITFAERAARAG